MKNIQIPYKTYVGEKTYQVSFEINKRPPFRITTSIDCIPRVNDIIRFFVDLYCDDDPCCGLSKEEIRFLYNHGNGSYVVENVERSYILGITRISKPHVRIILKKKSIKLR